MSTTENTNKRLQELGSSDYEMAKSQPDIRGWNVVDTSNRKIGEVDELIFDVETRKVRYIVLDMEDNEFKIKSKRVLIPIGLIELHSHDDDVILNNLTAEKLKALPTYNKADLDTDFEKRIRSIFTSTDNSQSTIRSSDDTDFYSHEHFEDNLSRKRSTEEDYDEHVRMRQEPSFLEMEGTNHREIDDDIDNLGDDKVVFEERDAIPITDSPTLRSGNDIDEWDTADDDDIPRTNTNKEQIDQNINDQHNKPTEK